MVLKLEYVPASPERPLKKTAGPTFRASESVGLGWGPIICIPDKFPQSW